MSSSVVVFGNDDGDSCVGENSVVVSGKGKGKDAVKPSCTVQYSCVKRLRERRLLSFLLDQGFHGAFRELTRETAALFDLVRMRRLVRRGRWEEALMYLNTFLAPLKSERRSLRAKIFHNFLLMHHRFANVVAGNKDMYLDKQYADGRSNSTQAERRFRSMNYSILAPDAGQLRAAIDWDRVRSHAEFVVRRMALATPELRRPLVLPSRCMMPHDVLPIGIGQQYCRQFRESSVDETLQAGLPRGCKLTYDLQPTGKEDASDALFAQTMLGTSTDNVKAHATSLVKIPGTRICQIITSTLKVHAKNPGISTPTNADTKRFTQAGCDAQNKMDGLPTVEDDIYSKSGSNSW
ncbi:hypothetical protein ACQJBY_017419 [Aegilops geniculata]